MFHCCDVLPIGEHLGTMEKFGLWANRHSLASVKGMLDKFLTHVEDVNMVDETLLSSVFVSRFEWPPPWLKFEQPHVFIGIIYQMLTFGIPKLLYCA